MENDENALGEKIQVLLRGALCSYNGDFSEALQDYAVARQMNTGTTDLESLAEALRKGIISKNEEIRDDNDKSARTAGSEDKVRYLRVVHSSDNAVSVLSAVEPQEFQYQLDEACERGLSQHEVGGRSDHDVTRSDNIQR